MTDTSESIDTSERTLVLPSGNSVTLRDWGNLTRGDKRDVFAAIPRGSGNQAFHFDLGTGLLRILVSAWSFNLPLPHVAAGSLDTLSLEDDGVLQAALDPVRTVLFPAVTDTPESSGGTVNLPSGAWVTLRDWHELNRGDKRTVLAAIQNETGSTSGFDLTTGLLTLLVSNWSYELPRGNAEALLALPWIDDAPLTAALAPVRRALFPAQPASQEQATAQAGDPVSPTTGADE